MGGLIEPSPLTEKERDSNLRPILLGVALVVIVRFRDGDGGALETLLRRYETPLFQFLVGILRVSQDTTA